MQKLILSRAFIAQRPRAFSKKLKLNRRAGEQMGQAFAREIESFELRLISRIIGRVILGASLPSLRERERESAMDADELCERDSIVATLEPLPERMSKLRQSRLLYTTTRSVFDFTLIFLILYLSLGIFTSVQSHTQIILCTLLFLFISFGLSIDYIQYAQIFLINFDEGKYEF